MADSTQELQLSLSITEVNQILEALGQRTYTDVYRLINKLQQQAESQLNAGEDSATSDTLATASQFPNSNKA
jgi:hypothetical protein